MPASSGWGSALSGAAAVAASDSLKAMPAGSVFHPSRKDSRCVKVSEVGTEESHRDVSIEGTWHTRLLTASTGRAPKFSRAPD
jgi:hypothetical protein